MSVLVCGHLCALALGTLRNTKEFPVGTPSRVGQGYTSGERENNTVEGVSQNQTLFDTLDRLRRQTVHVCLDVG